ncbi:MAG: T9SS type A sorting domain-containing protein [Crocinitomicaceae bacterium]|nr:T9SS type A sorting domain-containing protein [Crocinitomicaceae bacterium]
MLGVTCGVNSIDEIGQTDFQIYPNPTRDIINFQLEESTLNEIEIHVTDIYGRIRMAKTIAAENDLSLNVEALPKGIYFVQLLDEKNLLGAKRFVKL